MGASEISQFLAWLAVDRQVSASTQNQALSAVLFLYKQVLAIEIGLVPPVVRARTPERLPVVLSRDEVGAILKQLTGTEQLVVLLLCGAGLRLDECLELRVKDLDFDRHQITVRQGKGRKDRVTMLPSATRGSLTEHLADVRRLHQADLARGFGRVVLPFALDRKFPRAATEWRWQFVFPASRMDGNPVDRQGRPMYQERFIHAAIYKARPDVQSVIHAHTPAVLVFADSSVPLRPVYNNTAFLVGGVPVFEMRQVEGAIGMLVNDLRTGKALAQTLGDRPVALMRGHGVVVTGANIPETVSRAIFLDVNARVQAQAIAIGGSVTYLGPEDVVPPAPGSPATSGPSSSVLRSWAFWKQRAMGK